MSGTPKSPTTPSEAEPAKTPARSAKAKAPLRKHPLHQRVMDQAYALMQAQAFDQAQILFRKILAAEPGNPFCLYALGVIALRGGNPEEGIRLLEFARQSGYTHGTVYTHLGLAYFAKGDLDRAEEVFQLGRKAEPKNPFYPTNLAVIAAQRGDFATGLQLAQAALKLDPKFVPALSNAANMHLALKQFPESAECFEKVLSLSPGDEYASATLKKLKWTEKN